MRPEAELWWRQAEADLDAARQNLGLGLHFVVTWLVQQSAEKALKALWIDRQFARSLGVRGHRSDHA